MKGWNMSILVELPKPFKKGPLSKGSSSPKQLSFIVCIMALPAFFTYPTLLLFYLIMIKKQISIIYPSIRMEVKLSHPAL